MLMRMQENFSGCRVLSYRFSGSASRFTPAGHVAFAPVQTTYKPSVVLRDVELFPYPV